MEYGIPTPLNDTLVDMVKMKVDIGKQAWNAGLNSLDLKKVTRARYGVTYKPIYRSMPLERHKIGRPKSA